MSFLDDRHGEGLTNRITTCERDAIGWVAGYYASTEKTGVVYLQNSGLGNIVNPVTSLLDSSVYNFPMLLMVGWRGQPGQHDEPQHKKMGTITQELLRMLDIRFSILPGSLYDAEKIIAEASQYMKTTQQPYALIIQKKTFEKYTKQKKTLKPFSMTREDALKIILADVHEKDIVIATTGKTSREVFEHREATAFGHQNDFLMVGSMGLASSFAAEIALQKPGRTVYVLDGDGALLMNAGVLSTVGYYAPPNLFHIVFDNRAYDSTGGQPTTSSVVDFVQMALANNYKDAAAASSASQLRDVFSRMQAQSGPSMLVINVNSGSRPDLGRPTTLPIENKVAFMNRWREQ
jgi:phosphonopyruvate decarboxylase